MRASYHALTALVAACQIALFPPSPAALACEGGAPDPVARGQRFGEGPLLTDDGTRCWVEASAHRIVVQPPGAEARVLEAEVRLPAGLARSEDGRLLVAEFGGGRVSWLDPVTGDQGVVAESYGGRPLNGPNDLIVDADGGLWFTDPALLRANRQGDQQVFHLSPGGELQRVAGGLRMPNGLALLPDGSALVVAEWGAGRIWRYPLLGPGRVGERSRFTTARTPTPDGICIHEPSGRVFVATGPDLMAFELDGTSLGRVRIPGDPTNCAVVGDRMLVTTRTRVYELEVPPR